MVVKPKNATYFSDAQAAIRSLAAGLFITLRHIIRIGRKKSSSSIRDNNYFQSQEGISTISFPHETIPVPETGRYKLHNEIDDCIVCDKCAKICPVNCITIEPIKSPVEIGRTSDDTPKRIYAAKFDIDMGKCCFCGLCTTVCPTECLTMTPEYDFSVFDIARHNFEFGIMTPAEIEQKKSEWESHQKDKAAAAPAGTTEPSSPAKVAFKPKIKPPPSAS